nr:ribonuclease H2 subunit C [Anolis sagrei ordinatus]
MATRLALASLAEAPREAMHFLPCEIQHDGEAAIRKYFSPAIRGPDQANESSVSFRGRSLKGVNVSVPEGYVGLVLEKDVTPLLSSEDKELHVKSTFESLTVWNLEQAPKNTDEILMALHWPEIAEGIHSAVPDEE